MSYANLNDLVDRAGEDEILQVADRDDDGIADPDVVAASLTHADNTINGYLATRFAMPLAAVPPITITWAVAIARYHLHRDTPPDYVVRDYKEALAQLKDAARGLLDLPGVDGITPPATSSGSVRIEGPEPVFSRDKLGGWL